MTIVVHLLTAALVVGAGVPTARVAIVATPPVAMRERGVALRIDSSALLEREAKGVVDHTVFFVRGGGIKALAASGVEVVDEPDAPVILVALAWEDYEESIYRVDVRTQRPGEVSRLLETFTCACINSGLAAAVAERMPAALEQLDAPASQDAPPAADVPSVEPVGLESEPTPAEAPADEQPRRATVLGGTGIAGIVVAVGGLGMAGFGLSRLVVGETRKQDPSREQLDIIRDLRPPGRAWLGVGLGVAAVGVTMVVIDATLLRKRRERPVTLVPSFGPAQAGVGLWGRF